MTDISARIVTSHKEAAQRAADYLKQNLNFKISKVESLEMLARTLGTPNWPTLQSMAKQGRGPRIDDGKASVAAPTPVPAPEKTVVERLKDYYGTPSSWGESPDYLRKQWRSEVEDDDTLLGYWEMVEHHLDETCKMYPWERDADAHVKLATEAGLKVQHASEYEHAGEDEDNGWFVVKDDDALFDPESSESDAWARAAKYVLAQFWIAKQLDAAYEGHKVYTQIRSENVAESFAKMRDAFAETPAPEAKPKKAMHRPGEMSDTAREASSAVFLARYAGIYARCDVLFKNEFYPEWNVCDAKGEPLVLGFEEEEEAWQVAALDVRNKTCEQLGRSFEEWRSLNDKERLTLAMSASGLSELLQVLGLPAEGDALLDGSLSDTQREKTNDCLALAKAAQTIVEHRDNTWLVTHSCAREAIQVRAYETEQAAWTHAVICVLQEVAALTNLSFEQFVSLPQAVRIRHIEEAYKGKTCWYVFA